MPTPPCPKCTSPAKVVASPDRLVDLYCYGCAITWDPTAPDTDQQRVTRPFRYETCGICFGDGRKGPAGAKCPECDGFGEVLIEVGWKDIQTALLGALE